MEGITYSEQIAPVLEEILCLRRNAINLAKDVISNTFTKDDLFFCSVIDRCTHLMDGMSTMLQQRNLTCAGGLLRMQLDNCMRTYALFIAADKSAVIDCLIDGSAIRDQKDTDGKKMTDVYLKDKLSEIDSRFGEVYKQSSGYVHFSSKAFYQSVTAKENYHIEFRVGTELPERFNAVLLECAKAYTHYCKLQLRILLEAVRSKRRFEASEGNGTQEHSES